MKQADRVFQYMKDFGSITNLEAVRDLGVMCLAERVRDLRNAGIDVKSTPESGKNRYGETTRYVRYSLTYDQALKDLREREEKIKQLEAQIAELKAEATA